MNLTKNIFILTFLLILLSIVVSADDNYYRRLGDGCNSENYFGSCESGCKWEVIGNSLSKTCEVAAKNKRRLHMKCMFVVIFMNNMKLC